ncbi:zinc finger protein 503-like [Montipora capricornis]|uniref:zinc finger protein 503-like n=1 Tax=Montipora foliosa TaxID=591990 RepID=UPI0035F191A9
MPTRTIALKATESPVDISQSPRRVPLEALQMLTQSVSKCNQEYIQPLPFKEDEQKKSPLALLAATCSSIGKNESSKEAVGPEVDKSSQARKISEDERKSSFKPYKHPAGEAQKMDEVSGEKAGFRTPSKENNTSISPITNAKEERAKSSSLSYPVADDSRCGSHSSPQSRACGMFLEPNQQTFGIHSLHKDCGVGYVHPASIVPYKGSIQSYPTPTGQDTVPPNLKTHGMASSLPLNFPTSFPQCGCGFCSPHSGDAAPILNSMGSSRHLQLHNPGSTPYMDYLQRTVCRDVNCSNCKPQFSSYAFPYSVPQYGPHCTQCDNVKTEQNSQSQLPCLSYPHSMALYKAGTPDETSPYVCNWVAGSKHCGKSFTTSEDLFQHLRTHTQTGSQSTLSYAQSTCNIHGCPCKLRTSPLQSSIHSARYRPYYYKPPVFPVPPTGCYTTPYPLHGYDAHRIFK